MSSESRARLYKNLCPDGCVCQHWVFLLIISELMVGYWWYLHIRLIFVRNWSWHKIKVKRLKVKVKYASIQQQNIIRVISLNNQRTIWSWWYIYIWWILMNVKFKHVLGDKNGRNLYLLGVVALVTITIINWIYGSELQCPSTAEESYFAKVSPVSNKDPLALRAISKHIEN